MKKQIYYGKTVIKRNESTEGEPIEQKVERVTTNQEPITDTAPIIYTERKDGVQAEYNIRTDRFEVALEATDYIARSYKAKRANSIEQREADEKVRQERKQALEDLAIAQQKGEA